MFLSLMVTGNVPLTTRLLRSSNSSPSIGTLWGGRLGLLPSCFALETAKAVPLSMGQNRSSQDPANAIRLTDRVIEKFIRLPPVGRLGAGVLVFLLFT